MCRPSTFILSGASVEAAISAAARTLSGETGVKPTLFEFIAKDGAVKAGEISANPLFKDSEVVSVICVDREIEAKNPG